MEKKLYRDERRKVIAGVCAGLADYFGIDVAIIRLIFLLTLIFKGGGGLVYIILWIVLPKKDYSYINPTVDYTVPPQTPPPPFSDSAFKDPFGKQPYTYTPPPAPERKASTVGLIGGIVLILMGAIFLLDNFDVIPDLDFGRLWPLIIVAVGVTLIFTGSKKQPWHGDDWHKAEEVETPPAADTTTTATEDKPIDNPPTV